MGKVDKRGRNNFEHYTKMTRGLMSQDAWRALKPAAQSLYVWLRFEWKGPNNNNNGRIRLSCRQAALRIGITRNTAMGAFRQLQAKGFIVVTEPGCLGVEGAARGPAYELTELGMPGRPVPRHLYRKWKAGHDFDVVRHNAT